MMRTEERRYGETARAYAYRLIRDNIVSLDLEPGAPFNDMEVSRQIGISRTPVREAVLQLSEESRIIEVFPQRGMRIALIDVELVEETTGHLAKMLQTGEVDLLLDNCELDPQVFDRQVFRRERLLLAVPRSLPVNRSLVHFQIPAERIRDGSFLDPGTPEVSLAAFREEPFILLKPDNDTGKRAVAIFQKNGFRPRVLFQVDQQMTSYNITSSGIGLSFIGDTLISCVPPHPDVIYYKLRGENSARDILFYWKRGRYLSRAMEEFLREMGKGGENRPGTEDGGDLSKG